MPSLLTAACPTRPYISLRFPRRFASLRPICWGSATLRRCVSSVGGAHDSKLIRSMATAITNTVDWKLIWAQRGFRYFFFAMFVSLFGSGTNFAGVSWYPRRDAFHGEGQLAGHRHDHPGAVRSVLRRSAD